MTQDPFTALVIDMQDDTQSVAFREYHLDNLPAGDVLVRVAYSTLNYKDGLAITGTGKIIRQFPMIPGVDFAGEVVESTADKFQPGDQVILTGWGVGESHAGGFAEYARVKSEWLVKLPQTMTAEHAMSLGTAGFTAMMAAERLEAHGITPNSGAVLVTGASGGVGSLAVLLLARLGYTVEALTGRTERAEALKALGAANIVPRAELANPPQRPLQSSRWAGVIDNVGGDVLANVLTQVQPDGCVAAIGNTAGATLNTTVFPFILRGVTLSGINSVTVPVEKRPRIWERLGELLPPEAINSLVEKQPLATVIELAQAIVDGEIAGRILLEVKSS